LVHAYSDPEMQPLTPRTSPFGHEPPKGTNHEPLYLDTRYLIASSQACQDNSASAWTTPTLEASEPIPKTPQCHSPDHNRIWCLSRSGP